MNATSLELLRNGLSPREPQSTREPQDEKMDQIRELLVGDILRQTDVRLSNLEARLKDFETIVGSRLAAVNARLEALAGEVGAEHRASFDDLAKSVIELGERIRKIARD